LNLTIPLKTGWQYVSGEIGSIVYYEVGSDANQLPLYRTDPERKISLVTLQRLNPLSSYTVFQLVKKNDPLTQTENGYNNPAGPSIFAGLVLNRFDSEDDYFRNLYELPVSKKPGKDEIQTYRFGNVSFRGHLFTKQDKNGKLHYGLSLIKQFRKVSLVMNLKYSSKQELMEINNALSGMKINE
jgi:hypothetical protein